MFEQVRGETVPQHVGSDIARHPGQTDAALDAQPQRDRGKRGAAPGEKYIRRRACVHARRPSALEVTLQRRHRRASDRHDAFLVSLADDVEETGVQVKLFQARVAQLGKSQAGGVGQFQDGLVAERFRRLGPERREHRSDFRVGQRFGQAFPASRKGQMFGYVGRQQAFVFAVFVERPQRGDLEVNAFPAQLLLGAFGLTGRPAFPLVLEESRQMGQPDRLPVGEAL